AEEERGVLVLESEAREEAEEEPELLGAALKDHDGDVGHRHPEEWLEDVHGEVVADGEEERRDEHRQAGEELREEPAAEAPSHRAGERDEGGRREEREDPHREERRAEVASDPGVDGDERRLVDVAPVEVLAAREEVELVAEEAVLADAGEVHGGRERAHRAEENVGVSSHASEVRYGASRVLHRKLAVGG